MELTDTSLRGFFSPVLGYVVSDGCFFVMKSGREKRREPPPPYSPQVSLPTNGSVVRETSILFSISCLSYNPTSYAPVVAAAVLFVFGDIFVVVVVAVVFVLVPTPHLVHSNYRRRQLNPFSLESMRSMFQWS